MATATTRSEDLMRIVKASLEQSIESEANRLFDEMKGKVLENIENRRQEIVARTMINIMKQYDMQVMQDRVIITVKTDV